MKNIVKSFIIVYSPKFPRLVVYMLQSVEYEVWPYLKWFWRTQDFSKVMVRKSLDETKAAKSLINILNFGIAVQIIIGLVLICLGIINNLAGGVLFGLAIIFSYPIIWAHLICLPLIAGRIFVTLPKQRKLIEKSKDVFLSTKATKIAVAGSYGKTSMKELLNTVLNEGLNVAATPANKNVASSHALFAKKLKGNEDVLIIELGEGAPGDVERFSQTISPDMAVITGLSPAHLDKYKTIEAAGKDIFSLYKFLPTDKIFVNQESKAAGKFIKKEYISYNRDGLLGWKVSDVKLNVEGISFSLSKKDKKLKIKSSLLGKHQVGPLSVAAVIGLQLGLTNKQVIEGIAKALPYEHRMQPYLLNHAWIIDDTYNGNIEGIRAGTELLKELNAKRKIYVSPGLVEQGSEAEPVHIKMGELIADANPDRVVLMANSVTKYIEKSLSNNKYKGQVIIETKPLDFYNNLSNYVAAGDLVLMQNDWTDNYA